MRYEIAILQDDGKRIGDQQDFADASDPDRATIQHAGVLGVLSDGMGGLAHGHLAATTAVETFKASYARKTAEESIPMALERALGDAHGAVCDVAAKLGAEGEAGATIVAAVLREAELHWISAGDSRAYVLRDGRVFRLTVDHNYGEQSRFDANRDPHANPAGLTSFMGRRGGLPPIDGSVRPFRLEPNDCVLLASDGLHDALSDEQIGTGILRDLEGGCRNLIRLALEQDLPDQDNITVLAMRSLLAPRSGSPSATAAMRRPA